MKVTTVLNPAYKQMADFINNIPSHDYVSDKVICNNRNVVELIAVNDVRYVVKKYKRPTWANMFIYSFFRKSKARRSYEYATQLLMLGIETAEPVAYLECKTAGVFHTCYFVSRFLPYETFQPSDLQSDEKEKALMDLADFTCKMHEVGVVHNDYNMNNILFYKKENKFSFAFVDINRMIMNNTSKKSCLNDINRLGLNFADKAIFIDRYAGRRQWDKDECMIAMYLHRIKNAIRSTLKRRILKPLRAIILPYIVNNAARLTTMINMYQTVHSM